MDFRARVARAGDDDSTELDVAGDGFMCVIQVFRKTARKTTATERSDRVKCAR